MFTINFHSQLDLVLRLVANCFHTCLLFTEARLHFLGGRPCISSKTCHFQRKSWSGDRTTSNLLMVWWWDNGTVTVGISMTLCCGGTWLNVVGGKQISYLWMTFEVIGGNLCMHYRTSTVNFDKLVTLIKLTLFTIMQFSSTSCHPWVGQSLLQVQVCGHH